MEQDPQEDKTARLARTTAEVMDEIAKAVKADPIEGVTRYFNNFHLNLPEGESEEERLYREQRSMATVNVRDGYSPRRASENSEAFFQAVDRAVIEAGISLPEIKRLKDQFRQNPTTLNLTRLNMVVLKAFITLRAGGYNNKDLTT